MHPRFFALTFASHVVFLLGCGQRSDAPDGAPASLSKSQPPKETVVEISAQDLGKAFAQSAGEKASEKYVNKTLRIKGAVSMVFEDIIYLQSGEKFVSGQSIEVGVRFTDPALHRQLAAGQQVVVEGKFGGEGVLGPAIKECRLIEKSEGPPKPKEEKSIRVSATDLTRAFEEDKEAGEKKYGEKQTLLVEGVVKKVEVAENGVSIFLKGHTDQWHVDCVCTDKTLAERVKEGQKIKVSGSYYYTILGNPAGKEVMLSFCYVPK